jgi:DNA-binding transcriptional LysR family regulator
MDGLTLDQIKVLLTVAEHGSFSGAARALSRAQSAVTYAIQKLEEQVGTPLFDRSAYRPVLTEAGRALVPLACQIGQNVAAFRAQALSLSRGLEAELALVVDSLFPMPRLLEALKAFSTHYPTVTTRIYVESLGGVAQLVLDGTCALGVALSYAGVSPALTRQSLAAIELVPVVAPAHPLAAITEPIPTAQLRDHIQLVLTDRSGLTAGQDYGVVAVRTWRLGDLGAKHAMLLAGFGWGNMPAHMIGEDLRTGRLQILRPAEPDFGRRSVSLCAIRRIDKPIGPATRRMLDDLVSAMQPIQGDMAATATA